MPKLKIFIPVLFLSALLLAQNYQIPWWTINSGGRPGDATSYKINASIAQSSIGTGQSSSYKGSFGFWYGIEGPSVVPSGWIRMADIPILPSGKKPKSGSCMAGLNGKIYFLKASNTQDFHIFTPPTGSGLGTWTSNANDSIPLGTKASGDGKKPKKGASMIAFADAIYVLRGNNTPGFWKYMTAPPESIGWKKLQNITPGAKNPKDGSGLVAVMKSGNPYIFAMKGSRTSEFYLYDIGNNTWASVKNPPTGPSGKAGYKKGSCLCYNENDIAYALKGNYGDFFSYSLNGDSWHQLRQYDAKFFINRDGKKKKVKDGAGLLYYNNFIYMLKGGNTREFWKYDIAQDSWIQMGPAELWDIPAGGGKKVKGGGALSMLGEDFYAAKGANTPEFYKHSPPTTKIALTPNPTLYNEDIMAKELTIGEFQFSIAPNPAVNVTTVRYTLPKAQSVRCKLYNVYGSLVKSYTNSNPTKDGTVLIDAKLLSSGVYILRFNSGNIELTRKLILEK